MCESGFVLGNVHQLWSILHKLAKEAIYVCEYFSHSYFSIASCFDTEFVVSGGTVFKTFVLDIIYFQTSSKLSILDYSSFV